MKEEKVYNEAVKDGEKSAPETGQTTAETAADANMADAAAASADTMSVEGERPEGEACLLYTSPSPRD